MSCADSVSILYLRAEDSWQREFHRTGYVREYAWTSQLQWPIKVTGLHSIPGCIWDAEEVRFGLAFEAHFRER